MRNFSHALCVTLAFLSASAFCEADSVTDKGAVTALIQRLYGEPEASMVYGEFKGKYDPKKQCALLKQYIHESLIKQEKIPAGTESCDSPFGRFPGYTLQDDMGGFGAPPQAQTGLRQCHW